MTIADLRRARTARGLSLSDVSNSTRIGTFYLQKIEEGKLSALPPGLYARSFLRSYAGAVGLDPDAVTGLLPEEQAAGAGGGASSTNSTDANGDCARPAARDSRSGAVQQLLARHGAGVAGSEMASRGRAEQLRVRRLMAATFDGLLLASIHMTVLLATSAVCGVSLRTLLSGPGLGVFPLLVLITVIYVWLLGSIAGQTIGAMVLGVPADASSPKARDLSPIQPRPLTGSAGDGLTARLMSSMAGIVRRQRHHA